MSVSGSGEDGLPTRYIKPLGLRVLVRICAPDAHSRGGLILPASVQSSEQTALYGEVVEVARAEADQTALGENVSGVPVGSKVLFDREAGLRVPWDDRLRLINVSQIYAVVEELTLSELQ